MGKDDVRSGETVSERPTRTGSTLLGSSIIIQGELEGHEDAIVEGRFKGKITLPSGILTIARGAHVEAEVRVRALVLNGDLTGTVFAAERVEITESGRMIGDVVTPKIAVAGGAQFKGAIKIGKA